MASPHADAQAEKGRLLEEQDDESSSSELSGVRTAVASPINRLASIDIEGINDVDIEKEATNTQERPQKNGAKLVAWITVNTLATIGIVCPLRWNELQISTCLKAMNDQRNTDILRPCRSSPTKPSSPTHPFRDPRFLSHPSISS